jgi:hypothetical protein
MKLRIWNRPGVRYRRLASQAQLPARTAGSAPLSWRSRSRHNSGSASLARLALQCRAELAQCKAAAIKVILCDADANEAVHELSRTAGYRRVIAVPILREERPLGAIALTRGDEEGGPNPLSRQQIKSHYPAHWLKSFVAFIKWASIFLPSRGLIRSWWPITARTATSVNVRSNSGKATALTPGIRWPSLKA